MKLAILHREAWNEGFAKHKVSCYYYHYVMYFSKTPFGFQGDPSAFPLPFSHYL